MRNRSVLLIVLLASSLATAQQSSWQWVNPLPQGNILNGIYVGSIDSAIAVGGYGTVVRTINAGSTWHVQPTVGGMTDQFFGVDFFGTTGWSCGEAGQAFKSIDAGGTWSRMTMPTVSDLFSADFISSNTGWISGSNGTICYTSNGGTTWSLQSTGTTATLYTVRFFSALVGWAAGSGGVIIKTTNGGTTWTPQVSGTTQSIYSLSFTSTTTGWGVGAFGTILRTANGGTTWVPQVSGTSLSLYSVWFSSSTTGWSVGGFGTIRKTTNGGVTWFEQSANTDNDLYAVQFKTATAGWAVGDFGTIVVTTDGGTTWNLQSSATKTELYATHFATPSDGWSVGDLGYIIRTTDGGLTWSEAPTGVYQPLYGVQFVSKFTGWAVGDSGMILRTTNGGYTWTRQISRTDLGLYSVCFINENLGWTVGDFGMILKTAGGGTAWTTMTSPTTETLLRVKFLNSTLGFIVGYGGYVAKTTDGGTTWTEQFSGTSNPLYSIEIIDQNRAFIAGDFGTVLATTNGGTTWTQQPTGSGSGFYGITFKSATTGWAAGDDGTIIGTTNGGTVWTTQNSGSQNTFYEIQFVAGSSGGIIFATGIGGSLVTSIVSPTPRRTWTGVYDSVWTIPGNWNPIGVPEKLDSVLIPSTTVKPVIRGTLQQINIAGLSILPGAKLTIRPGIAQLVVNGNVEINGTLEIDDNGYTEVFAGAGFFTGYSGKFNPGKSNVIYTGSGFAKGTFYNLTVGESASVHTVGNIDVKNSIIALSTLNLRPYDTLTIRNSIAQAFQGSGITGAGTIKRAILQGATEPYRFESPATYVQFDGSGTYPDTLFMTANPGTIPPGFSDTLYVKRYYSINAQGGSNYRLALSLRYDLSETLIPVDELALFRDSSGVVLNLGSDDFVDDDFTAVMLDSVQRLSSWYLGRADYFPKHPFEFVDSLVVVDNGGLRDTLYFGAVPGATDGIDTLFGEALLGPKPPAGTHHSRMVLPSSSGSVTDLRQVFSLIDTGRVYRAEFQPGPGGYPVTISWKSNVFPSGVFFLRDAATHGGQFNVNMKLNSSYVVTSPSISAIEIANTAPKYYSVQTGWNMVSLPLESPTNRKKATIYPTATSAAFYYNLGYTVVDTLQNSKGYWLKFSAPQSIAIEGFPITKDTLDVKAGWNMVGAISSPVATTSVVQEPAGILGSGFYNFGSGYVLSDSVRPSRGYWVKSNAVGKLILTAGSSAQPRSGPSVWDILSNFGTIVVSDAGGGSQTLYAGEAGEMLLDAGWFEMPPPPPAGTFDARFSNNGLVTLLPAGKPGRFDMMLDIRSAEFPVNIKLSLNGISSKLARIVDRESGSLLGTASLFGGEIKITDQRTSRIQVSLDLGAGAPRAYALYQNYPNPFNPTTTIRFDIADAARVSLRIFNVLGQEVARLADDVFYESGEYALQWNADGVGSGVYFCQITAKDAGSGVVRLQQSKKLLLVR
jgi:photosystem II stability/assembly factor-like uncharacterized protein